MLQFLREGLSESGIQMVSDLIGQFDLTQGRFSRSVRFLKGDKMIKHVFIGFLRRLNEIEATRWYFRYHSKEVARFAGPWLRRYETYKAYSPPVEAKNFGAINGFHTELWYSRVEDFIEADPDRKPYTPPPGGWSAALGPVTMVPAIPTEDFLGREPAPEQCPILRWIRFIKYPEGVSLRDGEKWYLEVHSREIKTQSGLLKYVSHRTLESSPVLNPWHRIEELWYQDFETWRKANIEGKPNYTLPAWKKPEPFFDMASTFVRYKPDVDFLKDNPPVP